MSMLSTFFLVLIINIPIAFSAMDENYYLGYTCINTTKLLSNPVFRRKQFMVFNQITQNAQLPTNRGFYYYPIKKSMAVGPDTVYGLAQCRGDVSSTDCKTCLTTAYQNLLVHCPQEREAIVWYNHCLVKYADAGFLGKVDTSKWIYAWNTTSRMGGPNFAALAYQLMDQLHNNIITFDRGLFYSMTAHVGYLYGMSQCNRDIDRDDCKKCIQFAANYLNSQITNHKNVGQRADYVSCSIRFEEYPFF